MFVVEKQNEVNKTADVSASTAAIRGFSQFAQKTYNLLDTEGNLDLQHLHKFLEKYPEKPFILFGFTAPLWFQLIMRMKEKNISLKQNNGIVLHGGGWKKMQAVAISKTVLNEVARLVLGVKSVYNYYGMVEQTGSVFPECEEGYFHPSIYSEVFIRNENLDVAPIGEEGLLQTMSLLAESYPGNNLLTDDIGVIHGEDFCKCGRRGKFFSVIGRAPGVELRGCSDAK